MSWLLSLTNRWTSTHIKEQQTKLQSRRAKKGKSHPNLMIKADQRRQLVCEVLEFSTRLIRWKSPAMWQTPPGRTICPRIQSLHCLQRRQTFKTKNQTSRLASMRRMITFELSFEEAMMRTLVIYHTLTAFNLFQITISLSIRIARIHRRRSIVRWERKLPSQQAQPTRLIISSNFSTSK